MIINTDNKDIGVSLIKRNNKVSISLAKIKDKCVEELICGDESFPFESPLITKDSLKVFEFIIEAKNFARRINSL